MSMPLPALPHTRHTVLKPFRSTLAWSSLVRSVRVMARASKLKVRAKAASTPIATAAAPKATALDAPSSDSARRRQLSRRDTEHQVERCLKSVHFRHISEVSIAHKTVHGKTLRQQLAELLSALDKGSRIGSTTYAALARAYSDGESCVESLRPSDPEEPVDEHLVRVLLLCGSDSGSSAALKALQSYITGCAPLNERNLVGMVKATMCSKSLARANYEHTVLAIMKYCVRCASGIQLATLRPSVGSKLSESVTPICKTSQTTKPRRPHHRSSWDDGFRPPACKVIRRRRWRPLHCGRGCVFCFALVVPRHSAKVTILGRSLAAALRPPDVCFFGKKMQSAEWPKTESPNIVSSPPGANRLNVCVARLLGDSIS